MSDIMNLPASKATESQTIATIPDWFTDNNVEFVGFYLALHHHNNKWIKDNFLRHCKGRWLISQEKTPDAHYETQGEHFHICGEMPVKAYHGFMKNFKDKFNLRGVAKGDLARQYGKIRDIKDKARLLAYCMKDGNYDTNIDEVSLTELKKITFKPTQTESGKTGPKKSKDWIETVVQYIKDKHPNARWNMKDPRHLDEFQSIILKHLGKSAKAFDRFIITRLSNGVYNLLPKTDTNQKEFQQELFRDFSAQF
jgi:hypothetical protein